MWVILFSAVSLGAYGALAWLVIRFPAGGLLIWPAMGLVLYGFSSAAHECAHGNMSSRRWVNQIVGGLWLAPLLLNFEVHRAVHIRHHAHLGRMQDPERLPAALKPGARRALALYFLRRATVLKPLYFGNWRATWDALGRPGRSLDARWRAAGAAMLLIWIAAAGAATSAFPSAMLLAYWIPVGIFAPLVFAVLTFPEHVLIGEWPERAGRSRTIRSNAAVRMLAWNINLHTAHHLNPRLPFHALPAADRRLGAAVVHRERGYWHFYRGWLRGAEAASPG